MKFIIKKLIYSLIFLIEWLEYRNLNINNKEFKFLGTVKLDNIYTETDYGLVPVSEINITIPYKKYNLELENGLKLDCADDHIVFTDDHMLRAISDLTTNNNVMTKRGSSKVKKVGRTTTKVSMFDMTIETNEKSYYTNDILSHNTVSTAIFMLHTCVFNNSKNIMIIANKNDTVVEIIRKMKDIYTELPYFMKAGVLNWSDKKIAFDNKSAIHSQARSAQPAIGFAIDVLYIDEFAKIPNNIVRPYYRSAVPTVSSMENSKIIITSTPDGHNLFWELLTNAEKDEFDPSWNGYRSMRVYWWEVAGRRDTKLFFNEKRLSKFGFRSKPIIAYLKKELGYKIYDKKENGNIVYYIKFNKDDEKTTLAEVRGIRYNTIPLQEFCKITNWQEEQTKLLESPSAFKQEFDLQFLADDKLLFDSATIESIKEDVVEFDHIEVPSWENKLNIPYTNLKFIKDRPDLFDINNTKEYKIVLSLDLSDGLGSDYSTINMFRLMPKTIENIEENKEMFTNVYDFFKLEQIGLWRSNIYSVDEVAHILYMVVYELFNSDNVKVLLEMNRGFGDLLLSRLQHVFNGKNDFSTSIFLRFKHKKTDKFSKIGLNLSRAENTGTGKNVMIKEYQNAMKKEILIMHEETSARELTTFTKHETTTGKITYKAESGHDDCIMSLINLSGIFGIPTYKDMIDGYIQYDLSNEYKNVIYNFTETSDSGSLNSVEDMKDIYKKIYNNKHMINRAQRDATKAFGHKDIGDWWSR